MANTETPSGEREQYRPALRGNKMVPRCQARSKRTGQQCQNPARTGFRVCFTHGAGSHKREKEGRAKPAGRPLTAGVYSVRQAALAQEMLEQALQTERDLDNTDREITLARVILTNALALQPDVNELRDALKQAIDGDSYNPQQILHAARLYAKLDGYFAALSELNQAVVRIAKMRAEMVSQTAHARALQQFIEWTGNLKVVLIESLTPEQYRAIYERIRREVLGPLGLPKALDDEEDKSN